MNKKIILFIFSILSLVCLSKEVVALEEISFPDITFIINENGEWIEKGQYYKELEKQELENQKEKLVFKQYIPMSSKLDKDIVFLEGYCTYYADKFHGRKTASGEVYNKNIISAAMNGVNFGTIVRVTNLDNNKTIDVKVNDKIGSKKNIIDLSPVAFKKIANLKTGRINVMLEILK